VPMAWSDLLAEWLGCNPPLESLNLSHNRLGAGTGWAIATALKTNDSLNHLDLSFNPLTTNGVLLLLEGLRRNHSLHSLSLENTVDRYAYRLSPPYLHPYLHSFLSSLSPT
jgi:Ran GTPase-activating protein (RanGAP) involved in mRNA processing and transport